MCATGAELTDEVNFQSFRNILFTLYKFSLWCFTQLWFLIVKATYETCIFKFSDYFCVCCLTSRAIWTVIRLHSGVFSSFQKKKKNNQKVTAILYMTYAFLYDI